VFYFTVFCNLSANLKVKELLKSVHIWQSYRKNKSGTFLWPTVYVHKSRSVTWGLKDMVSTIQSWPIHITSACFIFKKTEISKSTCRLRWIGSRVNIRSLCLRLWSSCCRSHHTLWLTIFSWLKPVVVAFTAAVVERLTVTGWTHVRVA